ncbi:hypothetical protein FHS85_002225 [Rhodoligotrophos appendicifer]|uniref:hypothetical protein n=1 Tax=Rhodoligotrophos appendicifer TaxID=987056 RepID=UPI0011866222|nr:hypothetical protein [Rhodoligotrophos appendicifer]
MNASRPALVPRLIDRSKWPRPLRRKSVEVQFPGPLFVWSYAKLPLTLKNISIDDLDFVVPAGPHAGIVSYCRDAEFDPAKPDIMFCAGDRAGHYTLQAVERTSNIVLAEVPFEITIDWAGEHGPPLTFAGAFDLPTPLLAWGDDSGEVANANVRPAPQRLNIAVVFVDTADARYPEDAAEFAVIRDRWMNEVIHGVQHEGKTVSTRSYLREMSYNKYDISAQPFGPVHLSNNFKDILESSLVGSKFDNDQFLMWKIPNWGPLLSQSMNPDTPGGGIDLSPFTTVIFVQERWTEASGAVNDVWPQASYGPHLLNKGLVATSRCWGQEFREGRTIHSTMAHELFHTIYLDDQYFPNTGRNARYWDPMVWDVELPHLSLVHRLMLGWVQPEWVKTYNFDYNDTGLIREEISLSPIERGQPPQGRYVGIEVRIAAGWNYYIEYRSAQPDHVGDQRLPTNNALLLTDANSQSRPFLLLVKNDADRDGSVLTEGKNYWETDPTDPTFPVDFKVTAGPLTADGGKVIIEYGVRSRPDPAIRPWPAGPDRPWQSPDIFVRNARSSQDPYWHNTPWEGHANTVEAYVKNLGTLEAKNVRVEFFQRIFNMGGLINIPDAPLIPLPSDDNVKDILPGQYVKFTTNWFPPIGGHYCLVARIIEYETSGPHPIKETSIFNNEAQSNYTRFISRSSSPASREIAQVVVGNPFDKPTRVHIRHGQTNPLYRTYVEHTSLRLLPGEVRQVKVMSEFDPTLVGNVVLRIDAHTTLPAMQSEREDYIKRREVRAKFEPVPNKLSVCAFIDDPRDDFADTQRVLSGVEIEVATGTKTRIDSFYVKGRTVVGRVVEDTGSRMPEPVPTGSIILTYRTRSRNRDLRTIEQSVPLSGDGWFSANMPAALRSLRAGTVQAYYVPEEFYGDCESATIRLDG